MKKRILTLALTVILVLNFAGVANAAENQAKFNFTGTGFQVLFHSPPGVLFTFPSRYYALSVTG